MKALSNGGELTEIKILAFDNATLPVALPAVAEIVKYVNCLQDRQAADWPVHKQEKCVLLAFDKPGGTDNHEKMSSIAENLVAWPDEETYLRTHRRIKSLD